MVVRDGVSGSKTVRRQKLAASVTAYESPGINQVSNSQQRIDLPSREDPRQPNNKRRKLGKHSVLPPPVKAANDIQNKTANITTAPDSNWKRLQQKITQQPKARPTNSLKPRAPLTRILAIDCEMVGVGPKGADSRLARVAVINARSDVVLDTFVAVEERVTDFRTQWSGVRPGDLHKAPLLATVRATVMRLVSGRVLVGHAIKNDLDALQIEHANVRDTSKIPALRRVLPNGRSMARSLKQLAAEEVGLDIQRGEHSPVEDARAALYLYHKHRAWFNGQRRARQYSSP